MISKTAPSSKIKDTSSSIHNNIFKCDQCSFTSSTRITPNKHMNTKDAENESGNEC